MKVSRYASALGQPLIETHPDGIRNLPHADTINSKQQQQTGGCAKSVEPGGLKPRRRNRESCHGARGVPNAVIVGGNDMKRVSTRRQAAVIRFSSCAGVLPFPIDTIQFVAKLDSFRDR
jgi:hypothetical protein